ncbi:hypothetical protein MT418_004878 [Batrachochytrium dendrobatidis]
MNQAGHPSAALQQPMANHHAQGPPPQSPASTHSSIPGPATNMPTRPNYPPNSPASRQQQWRPAASNGRPPNMSGMPMNPQQQGPQQHLQGMSGNRSAQGSPSRPPQQIQQSQSTPQVRPLYGQSAQGQQPRPAFTSPTPAGPLMNNAMSTHMGQSQTSMQNGQRPMMSTPSMPQPYRPPQQATSPADLSAGQQPSPGVDELNQQFGSMGVASRASRSKRVYPGMQQSSPLQDQFPATQSQPGFPSNQQPGMASPQQFQQQPGMRFLLNNSNNSLVWFPLNNSNNNLVWFLPNNSNNNLVRSLLNNSNNSLVCFNNNLLLPTFSKTLLLVSHLYRNSL